MSFQEKKPEKRALEMEIAKLEIAEDVLSFVHNILHPTVE
jgi:hypothetical protein